MFTFYLYLAFIQTRNLKSPSNKHNTLRLTLLILIYLTLNYNIGWFFYRLKQNGFSQDKEYEKCPENKKEKSEQQKHVTGDGLIKNAN